VIISATLAVPGFIVESVLSLVWEFSSLTSWEICYRWQRMLDFGTAAVANLASVLVIILTVLTICSGDGLRDALDPRSLRR